MDLDTRIGLICGALAQGEEVLCVHYACENLYQAKDHPPAVTCISLARPGELATKAFSLVDRVEEETAAREIALLRDFFEFLSTIPHARLVHWNMNKPDYGFDALASRYVWLTKEQPPYSPAADRLHDLDALIEHRHGTGYAPHPKLPSLAALNGITGRYSLFGSDEAEKAAQGDYAAIQRSASEKARNIARLLSAFCEGVLVTQSSAGMTSFAGSQLDAVQTILVLTERMLLVQRSLGRRHNQRETIRIQDEYDAQDLFGSLLAIFFDDIREEAWTPDYAGGAGRVDFKLPRFHIAIELKHTRETMTSRQLADELMVDAGRYSADPLIRHLVCIVFDPSGFLVNPRGIESDLSAEASGEGLAVTVQIIDR